MSSRPPPDAVPYIEEEPQINDAESVAEVPQPWIRGQPPPDAVPYIEEEPSAPPPPFYGAPPLPSTPAEALSRQVRSQIANRTQEGYYGSRIEELTKYYGSRELARSYAGLIDNLRLDHPEYDAEIDRMVKQGKNPGSIKAVILTTERQKKEAKVSDERKRIQKRRADIEKYTKGIKDPVQLQTIIQSTDLIDRLEEKIANPQDVFEKRRNESMLYDAIVRRAQASQIPEKETTTAGTFATAAVPVIAPTLAGVEAAGPASVKGAAFSTALGVGPVPGALVGGLAAFAGTYWAVSKLQELGLEKVIGPEGMAELERQRQVAKEEHPVEQFLGEQVAAPLFFRPSREVFGLLKSGLAKIGSEATMTAAEKTAVISTAFGSGTLTSAEAMRQVANGDLEPLKLGLTLVESIGLNAPRFGKVPTFPSRTPMVTPAAEPKATGGVNVNVPESELLPFRRIESPADIGIVDAPERLAIAEPKLSIPERPVSTELQDIATRAADRGQMYESMDNYVRRAGQQITGELEGLIKGKKYMDARAILKQRAQDAGLNIGGYNNTEAIGKIAQQEAKRSMAGMQRQPGDAKVIEASAMRRTRMLEEAKRRGIRIRPDASTTEIENILLEHLSNPKEPIKDFQTLADVLAGPPIVEPPAPPSRTIPPLLPVPPEPARSPKLTWRENETMASDPYATTMPPNTLASNVRRTSGLTLLPVEPQAKPPTRKVEPDALQKREAEEVPVRTAPETGEEVGAQVRRETPESVAEKVVEPPAIAKTKERMAAKEKVLPPVYHTRFDAQSALADKLRSSAKKNQGKTWEIIRDENGWFRLKEMAKERGVTDIAKEAGEAAKGGYVRPPNIRESADTGFLAWVKRKFSTTGGAGTKVRGMVETKKAREEAANRTSQADFQFVSNLRKRLGKMHPPADVHRDLTRTIFGRDTETILSGRTYTETELEDLTYYTLRQLLKDNGYTLPKAATRENMVDMVLDAGQMSLDDFATRYRLTPEEKTTFQTTLMSTRKRGGPLLADFLESAGADPDLVAKVRDNPMYGQRIYNRWLLEENFEPQESVVEDAVSMAQNKINGKLAEIEERATKLAGKGIDAKRYLETGDTSLLQGLSPDDYDDMVALGTLWERFNHFSSGLSQSGTSIAAMRKADVIRDAAESIVDHHLSKPKSQRSASSQNINNAVNLHERELRGVYRLLYGELTDTAAKVSQSIATQRKLIAQHALMSKAYTDGKDVFWSHDKSLARGLTIQLPNDKLRYGKMAGKWVSVGTKEMLTGQREPTTEMGKWIHETAQAPFIKWLIESQSVRRNNQVSSAPRNWIRDFGSNFVQALRIADLFDPNFWKGFGHAIKTIGGLMRNDPAAMREMARIAKTKAYSTESATMLEEISQVQKSAMSWNPWIMLKRLSQFLGKGRALLDFPFKWGSYEAHLARTGSPEEAAEFVAQMWQKRTRVVPIVKEISQVPVFSKDYMAFGTEQIRTDVNAFKYGVREFRKGRILPLLSWVAGSAVSLGAKSAKWGLRLSPVGYILKATRAIVGKNDIEASEDQELENAVRYFQPEYYRNEVQGIWTSTKDGKPTIGYTITGAGSISPFPVDDIIMGIVDAETWKTEDPIPNVAKTLAKQIWDYPMQMRTWVEFATGKDIGTPHGFDREGFFEISGNIWMLKLDNPETLKMLRDLIVESTGLSPVQMGIRVYEVDKKRKESAAKEAKTGHKDFYERSTTPEDVVASWFSLFRSVEMTEGDRHAMIKAKVYQYSSIANKLKRDVSKAVNIPTDKWELRATMAQEALLVEGEKLRELVKHARKFIPDISDTDLIRILKEGGIDAPTATAVVKDRELREYKPK